MTLRIVVEPIGPGAGGTSACLGLAHVLARGRHSVGYLKPFGQTLDDEDTSADLFRLATSLRPPRPMPLSYVERELAAGRMGGLMEKVVALAEDVIGVDRVVVVEGVAPGGHHAHAGRLNLETARALDADVVLVGAARDTTPERLARQFSAMARPYELVGGGSRVVGVVVNRIPDGEDDGRYERAVQAAGLPVVAALAEHPEFARPRVTDLVHQLGFQVLEAGDLHRRVDGAIVAAQSVPGFLPHLEDGRLVIVPGDRHEVLLAAALAEQSGTRLAALLLTAGARPDPDVLRLCRPAFAAGLPVLFTDSLTYEATSRVLAVDPEIPADDEERARLVMEVVAQAYDRRWLADLSDRRRSTRVTPAAFRLGVTTEARKGDLRLAFTDGDDPRVVRAALRLHERGIVRCVLVGDQGRVEEAVTATGEQLPWGLRIVDPTESPASAEFLEPPEFLGSPESGDHVDPLVTALDIVARGEADGLVTGLSGTDHRHVVDLATSVVGLRDGVPLLTSAHLVTFPDEVVVYTDALLHERPTAEELAGIALAGAAAAEAVGLVPRIALVTAKPVTSDTDVHRRVDAAAQIVRDRRPDVHVEGPIALSTASRGRPIAGCDASVYAFADLATATATLRATAGVVAYGPVLLGLNRPVNIAAPDATEHDVLDLALGTAAQASMVL